jgi:MerR family transcriptional regulator, redox-sensitive transcriptional activator SoxR
VLNPKSSSKVEVKHLILGGLMAQSSAVFSVEKSNRRRLTVGELAERAGVATSTLRFYEEHGLIASERTESGHRRYRPDALRRVSFIRVAQRVGLTLDDIKTALASLPKQRTPSKRDWERLSTKWQPMLTERIATLQRLQTELSSCIGCGCLSLESCGLWNAHDEAATLGTGARYLESDERPKKRN